jgi:hypothetical protein
MAVVTPIANAVTPNNRFIPVTPVAVWEVRTLFLQKSAGQAQIVQ